MLARRINNHMPKFTVEQLVAGLGEISKPVKSAKVALLGLAYKANIADDRESPSYEVLQHLKALDMEVRVFDPYITHASTSASFDEALAGVDAVVLCTAHALFLEKLTPEVLVAHRVRVVVDGRNVLLKADLLRAGLVYKGIGR